MCGNRFAHESAQEKGCPVDVRISGARTFGKKKTIGILEENSEEAEVSPPQKGEGVERCLF
jgi:hypothetical protein